MGDLVWLFGGGFYALGCVAVISLSKMDMAEFWAAVVYEFTNFAFLNTFNCKGFIVYDSLGYFCSKDYLFGVWKKMIKLCLCLAGIL